MKFTKIIAAVMAFAMALSLAACSGSKTDYIIYSDNAFAPFEFLDEKTNEFIGVDMDLLAAIAEDQGFTYEMKNEGFDAAMGAVQAGTADAMIAGMTINDDRLANMSITVPYMKNEQVIVAKK